MVQFRDDNMIIFSLYQSYKDKSYISKYPLFVYGCVYAICIRAPWQKFNGFTTDNRWNVIYYTIVEVEFLHEIRSAGRYPISVDFDFSF